MGTAISILVLIVGLVLGMPIPYAFGADFLWLTYFFGFNPSTLLASGYTQINSTILLAIPLFVLAGKVMEKGLIGDALIGLVQRFVGRIKSGLGAVAVIAATVIAAAVIAAVVAAAVIAAVVAAAIIAAVVAAVIIALAEDDNDIDVVQTEVRGKRLDGIRALVMDARAAGGGDPADADDGGLLNIGINAPVVDMVVGAGDGHGGPPRHFHAGMIGLRVRAERVRVGHGEGRIVVIVAQDCQKQVRAHARHVAGRRRSRAERKQRQRECQQEDSNHECLFAMSCFFHVDYIRLSH